jgi:hypothetical protein
MMATIYFEAELEIGAIEIDDVFAYWMLSAELVPAELPVAQEAPDHTLLGRQLAPRGPRESPEAWHRMSHQSRGYLGVVTWEWEPLTTEPQRGVAATKRGLRGSLCGWRSSSLRCKFSPGKRCGEPSPSGRGQGEGLDVTFTSAVLGTGASNSRRSLAVLRTNEVTSVLILAKCDACTPDATLTFAGGLARQRFKARGRSTVPSRCAPGDHGVIGPFTV